MVQFVFFLQPAQDGDRVLNRGFADKNRLKPALKCRVLLDMLLIFIQRRCANAMQLSTRQSGLDKVGGIHRAFALARANQRVHFVNEQDNIALGLLDFVEHAFQPLFKLATIFCASDQRTHIERQQFAMLQAIGDIAIGDAQR